MISGQYNATTHGVKVVNHASILHLLAEQYMTLVLVLSISSTAGCSSLSSGAGAADGCAGSACKDHQDTAGSDAETVDCGRADRREVGDIGDGAGRCEPSGECPCIPDCAGKACGPDGCDGECGVCRDGEACSEDGLCPCPFVPCGGLCCAENQVCFEEQCCTPDCGTAECGDDHCGGSCGSCPCEDCMDFETICGPEGYCLFGVTPTTCWMLGRCAGDWCTWSSSEDKCFGMCYENTDSAIVGQLSSLYECTEFDFPFTYGECSWAEDFDACVAQRVQECVEQHQDCFDYPHGPNSCLKVWLCVVDCGSDMVCTQNCIEKLSASAEELWHGLVDCLDEANFFDCPDAPLPDGKVCVSAAFAQCQLPLQACASGELTCAEVHECAVSCLDSSCFHHCFYNGTVTAQLLYSELEECVEKACDGDVSDQCLPDALAKECADSHSACLCGDSCFLKYANGEPCASDAQCQSGHCADFVCCDQPCQGQCEGCGVSGSEGACTQFAPGTDPDDECGKCNVCGSEGKCSPVESGEDPKDDCMYFKPVSCHQDGTCDGNGACRLWGKETGCN